MRDDARPQDGFSWTRPRVPFGDDPFVFHDPATLTEGGAPTPANDARPPRRPEPAVEAPIETAPAPVATGDEMWVELPAEPAAGKRRARKPRGKAAEVEPVAEATPVEAVAEAPAAPEPEPEAAPPVKPKARSRAKAKPAPEAEAAVAEPETVVELFPAAPEPVPAEPEPAPVAARPDPAEIVAPPEKPKRGWWRRG
jgi:ribonuclease E